jgi:hypothetical protein
VCDALCGSTPIITAAINRSFVILPGGKGPRRACLIPDRPAFAPLASHATARPAELADRS